MIFLFVALGALFLAFANGANDNFKGVATLFGSGSTSYRKALFWAIGTTLLGSVTAIFMAANLVKAFGGKGLIDDAIALQPEFAAAVALGAAVTVLIATRIGMPISTTHSLVGALIGTGIAAGSSINLDSLWSKFMLPLLISPVIAIGLTATIYPILSWIRKRSGITSEFCICIGQEVKEVVPASSPQCQAIALEKAEQLSVSTGELTRCESKYRGKMMGLDVSRAIDLSHFVSSGIVSFARGLNDTPKIAALFLLVPAFNAEASFSVVGVAIALGAYLCARRVAETMSQKITAMNHGQGFTSNLITGFIVIFFSRFGLPVSTTHVSCGSLFGLGAVTGTAKRNMIGAILMAWVITLPSAGAMAAIAYLCLKMIFG